ncbi:insulin receptor substrate 2 isoform X2 [Latimeria chalumnae]|uniref:Insulin receptor substrate 2 n=1 Tax=Latimeria chalumnae TaxID=7897 RepID=H3B7F9_LATCH|nr:PREDICTED: insulin receptor substrate 2 isoform X2 [Latimeria chalumnae]|eukprot:XP_005997068.1 PREDICTED: insulin receptor substrate 2 isoform X2 [Latimeria chalumnae]
MASPPTTGGCLFSSTTINNNNIKKSGYLKKQKHGHKRFFVLKEQSDGYPARLEYYENEKKWKNKSAAKRVIPLDSCLNINKRADAKNKYLIALYTKDEYFVVAAENEQEQESWYRALTDLMNEGKVYDGSNSSTTSILGIEDLNYGLITPANAAYKEVWQVNLKPKGLGQSKNLTGVYRLCLSIRTIGFVKMNSEVPAVSLQLMNIRRCGHSDNFFFIEVGRSASTGPGELWMQVEDCVVAQNIHETILEGMKAMKELSEFRPRSKSQSSGSNPISVPTRRHLNNLPPSQTGLPRRSRTDSMAATSPANKFTSCRLRTASEGDGTMSRPISVTGSPISPSVVRTLLNRSNTISSKHSRVVLNSSLQHSRSMSMPVSHSPPSATSPVSLSSNSQHGSGSDTIQRPSSGSASVSGSPSDCGFMSFDEYGSSPGDIRQYSGNRSNTPESFAETPPAQEGGDLYGYMTMERPVSRNYHRTARDESLDSDRGYRKRTYSLTTPSKQKTAPHVSSASLDEYTLMKATITGSSNHLSSAASPKVTYNPYPEDYGDIEIGSHRSSNSNLGDDGYMSMTPGVVPLFNKNDDYMPMSPTSVSAPKQIINPRSHFQVNGNGCKTNSPGGSCSPDDNGYMRMWCGSKLSVESSDGKLTNGDYINMSPIDHCASVTPPDYFFNPVNNEPPKQSFSFHSLPRSYKTQFQKSEDNDQYVLMNSSGQMILEEPVDGSKPTTSTVLNHIVPSPIRQSRTDSFVFRGRAARPNRLSLDTMRTLPSMNEHPLPPGPKSPGEYINIDFSERIRYSPASLASGSHTSLLGSTNGHMRSPLSDYMNLGINSQSPKSGTLPVGSLEAVSPVSCSIRNEPNDIFLKESVEITCISNPSEDDYTEMAFGMATTSPQPISQKIENAQVTSPTSGVKRLTLIDQISGVDAFMIPSLPPDPNQGAKVIRADPQGRRRHSSETFSSTTMVTPVSPSFAHDHKRHNSASVENVSLRKSEGMEEEYGSPMCRETSAGFQNGLNYIALDLMDESLGNCDKITRPKSTHHLNGSVNGVDASTYASIDFLPQKMKEAVAAVKD